MSPFACCLQRLWLSNGTDVLMVQPACFAGRAYFQRAVSSGGNTSSCSCVYSKNVVVCKISLGIVLHSQIRSSQMAEMYCDQYLNGLRNHLRLSGRTQQCFQSPLSPAQGEAGKDVLNSFFTVEDQKALQGVPPWSPRL